MREAARTGSAALAINDEGGGETASDPHDHGDQVYRRAARASKITARVLAHGGWHRRCSPFGSA
jgi:hypothetical protein